MRITQQGNSYRIDAPYRPGFNAAVKELGGLYYGNFWWVPARELAALRPLLRRYYGMDDRSPRGRSGRKLSHD